LTGKIYLKMNKIILVISVFVVGYFAINNFILTRENDKYKKEIVILKENEKQKTVIYRDKIIHQVKYQDKIITKIEYLPPESHTTITTNNQDQTTLDIQKKGFCLFPAINGIASNTFQFGFGARLFYYDRYGLGVGISNELKPYLYIDRRISDFIPFCQNTAVGVSYDGNIGFIVSVFL